MNVFRPICVATVTIALLGLFACSGGGGEPGTATPPPSESLRADAGQDQSVSVGTFVTLNGSKSTNTNQTGLIYTWTLAKPASSSATLSNPASVTPTLTVDVEGTYEATLIVKDAQNQNTQSTPDAVLVTAAKTNLPPTANAGQNRDVFINQPVTLDGSGSHASGNKQLTYNWSFTEQPTGSNSTLSDATAKTPSFTPDTSGPYKLRLVVNDGTNDSTPASVTIIASVKPRPTADAGPAQSAKPDIPITLDGSKSKAVDNGPLTYKWSLLTKPQGSIAILANADPKSPISTFTPDVAGDYVAQLIVNDGTADSAAVTVNITVSTELPTANAGDDQNDAKACRPVTLNGSSSRNRNNGPISPNSYIWTFDSKPANSSADLSNSTTASPTFTPDRTGEYRARLEVKEDVLVSSPAFVKVTVTPTEPVALYGPPSATGTDTCAGCHKLGTFDSTGQQSDLSNDGFKVAIQFPNGAGNGNHPGKSLTNDNILDLCGIFQTH